MLRFLLLAVALMAFAVQDASAQFRRRSTGCTSCSAAAIAGVVLPAEFPTGATKHSLPADMPSTSAASCSAGPTERRRASRRGGGRHFARRRPPS